MGGKLTKKQVNCVLLSALRDTILRKGARAVLLTVVAALVVLSVTLTPSLASLQTEISSDALESLVADAKTKARLVEQEGTDALEHEEGLDTELSEQITFAPSSTELGEDEGMAIAPTNIAFAPFAATTPVSTWDQLRAAMSDASVDHITLAANVTRTSSTLAANDLPALSRSLTIDGNGYTLNLNANGTTAVNRLGITLAGTNTATLTLTNITIVRTSTYPFVGYTGATGLDTSTVANSRFWTVNFDNLSSSGTASILCNVSDGTVIFTGTTSWNMNSNDQMIYARVVHFYGGTHTLDNRNTGASSRILRMQPNANNTTYPVELKATDGAQVRMTTMSNNQVVWINSEIRDNVGNTPAYVTVTGNSLLDIEGVGYGTGATGATLAVAGGAGGYTITDGGVLRVHSLREGSGQPAIIQQIPNGNFVVDGAGSELEARSWGASNNLGSTLRFRLVGNQTFSVTNEAKVTIVKERKPGTTATGSDAAALRFGSAIGNTFVVKSGGWVRIENFGNGTRANPGTGDGYNVAAEYDANDFGYYLEDEMSSVELIAHAGAALNAKNLRNGTIYVGPGSIFVASGHPSTNVTASATLRASGGGTSFVMDRPLYYDFVNMLNSTAPNIANTGGSVFNLSNGDTFTSIESDVAVWRIGVNRVTGNPDADWTLITYTLSGTELRTVASDTPSFVTYYNSGANNSTKAENYTRISGNNAKPIIDGIKDATNADRYVRAYGRVPEGRDFEGRPFWTDEVWGTFEVEPVEGTAPYTVASSGSFTDSLVRSYIEESLYEVQQNVDIIRGSLQLRRDDGALLHAGDTYTVTGAWRSVNSQDIKRHEATRTLPQSVVVSDVTPPVPGSPSKPSIQDWHTTITGTWTLADQYDNGPASLIARVKRGSSDYVTLPGTGVVNPNGTWTFTIASTGLIEAGDLIALILVDDLGNANPVFETKYRDTTFPAAAHVVVVEGDLLPYFVRYFYGGVEDTTATHIGYVSMPSGTVNLSTDFPAKPRVGYTFGSSTPSLPAHIDEDHYEIRIYYVVDPTQTVAIPVEYYFDGVRNPAYDRVINPQILSNVTTAQVILDPRPRSYILADPVTDPILPVAASTLSGSKIKVYYVSTLQDLTITKTVLGDFANRNKQFDFELTLLDANDAPLPTGQVFEIERMSLDADEATLDTLTVGAGGKVTFKLAHGDSVTLKDVRSIHKLRAVESDFDGYTVQYEDSDVFDVKVPSHDTGVIVMTADDRTVDFTNTLIPVVPSGITQGDPLYNAMGITALLLASVVFMALLLTGKLRLDEEGGAIC